jgi:hypothetical protein
MEGMAPEAINQRMFSSKSDGEFLFLNSDAYLNSVEFWSNSNRSVDSTTSLSTSHHRLFFSMRARHSNCECTDQFARDHMNQMASINNYIPKDAPTDLQNIVAACFRWDPQSRISFAKICERLQTSTTLSAYFNN